MTPAFAQDVSERSISVGDIILAELDSDDGLDPHRGRRADAYLVQGAAGDRLEIVLTSDEFDCYLILEGPNGVVLAENDDGAGSLNSRVQITLPLDGLYRILASSYALDNGDYRLVLRAFRPQPMVYGELSLGESVEGRLTDTDAMRGDHRLVDGYRFQGDLGQAVRLRLESDSFDTYLYLMAPTGEVIAENDDRSSESLNSEVVVTLPYTGLWEVLVTSYSAAEGDYRLWADLVDIRPLTVTGSLDLGSGVSDELNATSGSWGQRYTPANVYTLDGEAGQRIEITLTATEFDPKLILLSPDGLISGRNDDSSGTWNSLLSVHLAQTGTYQIVATSSRGGSGAFRLEARVIEQGPLEVQTLDIGDQRDAELSDTDTTRVQNGAPMDLYAVELNAGESILVRMHAQHLNSYLWVTAPNGEVIAEDDDGGEGLDALLEITAPFTGQYLIVATAPPGADGAYSIALTAASAAGRDDVGGLEFGQSVEGRLERGDGQRSVQGSYRDLYRLQVQAGALLEIQMTSVDFDAYLMLLSPSNVLLAQDDDGGAGFNSRIQTLAPVDGEYTVVATSYRREVGTYQLIAEPLVAPSVVQRLITPGESVDGELSSDDLRSSRYATLVDVYELNGELGERVIITMTSTNLDCYLSVVDPNGEMIAQDDDGGGGLNSRVDLVFHMPGIYRVLATSFSADEGEYTLSIEAGIPAPATDPFHVPGRRP